MRVWRETAAHLLSIDSVTFIQFEPISYNTFCFQIINQKNCVLILVFLLLKLHLVLKFYSIQILSVQIAKNLAVLMISNVLILLAEVLNKSQNLGFA